MASSNVAAAEGKESKSAARVTPADIKSAPPDPRFPSFNQTKHCYMSYIEYYKCIKEHGEDDNRCNKYKWIYKSLCPYEWVENWEEQRANGNFPGRY